MLKKSFLQTLKEAEQLDISIINMSKLSDEKIKSLLNIPVTVTEKTDGTKLTLIRNDKEYSADWRDNWIVAYKSNILNPEDFVGIEGDVKEKMKAGSIGVSQYRVVHDILADAHPNCKSIPPNTEFFLEFVMRKPTLTRTYSKYHNLILIAWSPTSYRVVSGRVYSTPTEFNTESREQFAKLLNVQIPASLFTGKLSGVGGSFDEIKRHFLGIESVHGGLSEGVVLEFKDGQVYKILQDDQHDVEKRGEIKRSHEPKDPGKYWSKIRQYALDFVQKLDVSRDFHTNLSQLSKQVYQSSIAPIDLNKSEINAKDDIFLTAKTLLMRKSPGNNGALFIGRFSPLTIAHYNIINNALETYDSVTVNIVKSKVDAQNPFPVEFQREVLERCFGSKIEVVVAGTGNLVAILQKSKHLINVVLAGTDRVAGYRDQLKRSPDVEVVEIPRTDDISATRVRRAIADDNVAEFKKLTPRQTWDMFDRYKAEISKFK